MKETEDSSANKAGSHGDPDRKGRDPGMSPSVAQVKAEKGLILAIVLSAFTLLIEIAGGLLSGSLSLMSDAVHVFLDLLSLLFSYGAIRVASLPPTDTRTFGGRLFICSCKGHLQGSRPARSLRPSAP